MRINISAGERKRYAEIMGVKEACFDRVCQNIRDMVEIKSRDKLPVTIGLQMVLMPEFHDQIMPLAGSARNCGRTISSSSIAPTTRMAILASTMTPMRSCMARCMKQNRCPDDEYKVVVKWSKIEAQGISVAISAVTARRS